MQLLVCVVLERRKFCKSRKTGFRFIEYVHVYASKPWQLPSLRSSIRQYRRSLPKSICNRNSIPRASYRPIIYLGELFAALSNKRRFHHMYCHRNWFGTDSYWNCQLDGYCGRHVCLNFVPVVIRHMFDELFTTVMRASKRRNLLIEGHRYLQWKPQLWREFRKFDDNDRRLLY